MKKTVSLPWITLLCFLFGIFTYLFQSPYISAVLLTMANLPYSAMVNQLHDLKRHHIHRMTVLAAVLTASVLTSCSGAQGANQGPHQGARETQTAIEGGAGNNPAAMPSDSDRQDFDGPVSDGLTVHFLDVGQGLSILCESDGRFLLYDGGDSDTSSFVVSYLKKQGVETLDYVIASHYDADHLSGLIGALNAFQVGIVIGPDYAHSSKLYQSFLSKVSEVGRTVEHPGAGDEYTFGNSRFEILGPTRIVDDSNDNSIVIKLSLGDTSYIFAGDAEHGEESDMVRSGADLSCDVLSVGHHGSASSTSWDFLQKTLPEYAVISCGVNNHYGHPDADTIEKLQSIDAKIYRTDEQGTVTVFSDGAELTWSTVPSDNYGGGTGGEGIVIQEEPQSPSATYVINKNSRKFHYPDCGSVPKMNPDNYEEYIGSREELIAENYSPCKNCNP